MSFPKLKGSINYKEWARSMKSILRYEELWVTRPPIPDGVFNSNDVYVDGKGKLAEEYQTAVQQYDKRSMRAHMLILMMCENKAANLIERNQHGFESWAMLAIEYSDSGFTIRHSHLQLITQTTLDSCNGSLETLVDTIRAADQALDEMGSSIPHWILTSSLLTSLNGKYSDFVRNTIISIGAREPDFNTVVAGLQEVNRFSNREEKATALALSTKKSNKNDGGKAKSSNKSKDKTEVPECKDCPKSENGYTKRHWPKDCWSKHPD